VISGAEGFLNSVYAAQQQQSVHWNWEVGCCAEVLQTSLQMLSEV